jgi:solute carrier family 13 (sodium-dependent dicarboxylate transporter), member 2/3/5
MTESKVIIDKRPISKILFDRLWRFATLVSLFALLYLFMIQEPWDGLTVNGYRALGAFLFCMVLWVTNLIPLAVTGLLAIAILPLLNVLPADEVFSYFGNEALFFILGAFILAAAIMKTGLSTRLSLFLLKGASDSPKKLVFRILFSTAILSCVMSEHAVAAFFFPIVLEIARALEFEPFGGEYGKTLFLAMAWGCVIGGIVTFLGGARTPLALALFHEMTGEGIGFTTWMQTSLLVAIPLFVSAYFILTRFYSIDVTDVESVKQVLIQKRKKLGQAFFKEYMVGFIVLISVALWITKSETLGLANIAIAAVVALFVFRLIAWKDVDEYVNWGIILMYGGAISLGRAVYSSGALEWVAKNIMFFPHWLTLNVGGAEPFWLIAILSLLVIVLTEFVSNVAVVALTMPLALSLVSTFNLPAEVAVYAVALPSGLAFLLPMSTPSMAIAFSSGYLKLREILLPGLVLMFLGWVFFMVVVNYIWPLFGMALV